MAEQTDMRYFYALGLPDLLKPLKAKPQQMVDILVKKRKTFYEISSDPWVNAAGMTARRQQATETAQQEFGSAGPAWSKRRPRSSLLPGHPARSEAGAEVQLAVKRGAVRLWSVSAASSTSAIWTC
jgi:hypothetical protein